MGCRGASGGAQQGVLGTLVRGEGRTVQIEEEEPGRGQGSSCQAGRQEAAAPAHAPTGVSRAACGCVWRHRPSLCGRAPERVPSASLHCHARVLLRGCPAVASALRLEQDRRRGREGKLGEYRGAREQRRKRGTHPEFQGQAARGRLETRAGLEGAAGVPAQLRVWAPGWVQDASPPPRAGGLAVQRDRRESQVALQSGRRGAGPARALSAEGAALGVGR